MQLNIYIFIAFKQPQACQYLLVKMGLYVGQLLLFYEAVLFRQSLFIIVDHFIERIKKLHNFKIIIRGISLTYSLKFLFSDF